MYKWFTKLPTRQGAGRLQNGGLNDGDWTRSQPSLKLGRVSQSVGQGWLDGTKLEKCTKTKNTCTWQVVDGDPDKWLFLLKYK